MLQELSLLMFLVAIQTTLSSPASTEDVSIDLGSDGLFKLPLTETSDSTETKKSLKEYYRWLSKKEQKMYLDKHRQEMSQEEKNQVKFYENLLQHVKSLSKKMSGRRKI